MNVIFATLMLVLLTLKSLFKRINKIGCKKCQSFITEKANEYQYNNILTFLKESFLPILLFAVINVVNGDYETSDMFSLLNIILSIAYIGIILGFYIFCFWFVIKY